MQQNHRYFTDPESIKTIDTVRLYYMVIAILAFVITEFGRNFYRPYIYRNQIEDYGLADSIGNLGGIIVQIFFTLAILNSKKKKAYHVFILLIAGYILYEIAQPYLPRGVFDLLDVWGTIVGGVISLIIWLTINKTVKNKVLYKF